MLAVIAMGLASRGFPELVPAALGKYPGDALWALMIFLGIGAIAVRVGTVKLALLAFASCAAVEASQLWHPIWLDEIRRTTIGHLVLGFHFAWTDLAAYAVGIVLGMLGERLTRARGSTSPARSFRSIAP